MVSWRGDPSEVHIKDRHDDPCVGNAAGGAGIDDVLHVGLDPSAVGDGVLIGPIEDHLVKFRRLILRTLRAAKVGAVTAVYHAEDRAVVVTPRDQALVLRAAGNEVGQLGNIFLGRDGEGGPKIETVGETFLFLEDHLVSQPVETIGVGAVGGAEVGSFRSSNRNSRCRICSCPRNPARRTFCRTSGSNRSRQPPAPRPRARWRNSNRGGRWRQGGPRLGRPRSAHTTGYGCIWPVRPMRRKIYSAAVATLFSPHQGAPAFRPRTRR